MSLQEPQNRRRPVPPDVSQALENSLGRAFSHAAWLILLMFISMVCGVIGVAASLLDRIIQGEEYVPTIGVWTGSLLFIVCGCASTSLLAPREQSVAKFAKFVLTFAVLVGVRSILDK